MARIRGIVSAYPLTAFLAAGGVLYLLSTIVVRYGGETIVIDTRLANGIVNSAADRLGRDLTPDERSEALARHLDEEILVREAHRRGLHLESPGARSRLLRRMRVELSQGLPEPTRAQLRAYYRTNAARYGAGFDRVEPVVRMHWVTEKRAEVWDRRMRAIRERYEVIVETPRDQQPVSRAP